MASVTEVSQVRFNTGRTDNVDPYTDAFIGGLIDGGSVSSATLAVWRSLAAKYSTLVNVSEAGASHALSDLFKHATAMASHWSAVVAIEIGIAAGAPRVSAIVRLS